MKRKNNPFPGVAVVRDRHGQRRFRLRRRVKGRQINCYLPGSYGSAEFRTAYEAAHEGAHDSRSRAKPGTFGFLIEQKLASPPFRDLSPATQRQMRYRFDWIKSVIGAGRYADTKARHVEALMAKKSGATAANWVKKDLTQLFTFAVKHFGLKGENPAKLADSRKVKSSGFHTWAETEIEQFRNHFPTGTKPRLAFEIFLNTGAARQDAAALTRANIRGARIAYRRGKTGQLVDLPIMPELARELSNIPATQLVLLMQRIEGKPYTPARLGISFKQWCVDAHLPDRCSAHGLRKAGARRLAEAGATEFEVMSFLGHSTAKEASRYTAAANRSSMADTGLAKLKLTDVT